MTGWAPNVAAATASIRLGMELLLVGWAIRRSTDCEKIREGSEERSHVRSLRTESLGQGRSCKLFGVLEAEILDPEGWPDNAPCSSASS
jgi:hypothetical protein